MALSGMRISELYGLSPIYGAQDHIKIGINTIYALTTKQEKLTLDSQTADDVFITNRTGFRAFHVLNAINRPY
ncbi:site-specific integrase, partial [Vibrio anguillarum]|nr:site-specific integrase [Vibrio anguillarum]